MAFGKLPKIGSLIVSDGSGSDECSLCGNFFDSGKVSERTPISLPCIMTDCHPCVSMWHILDSPVCLACYADFKCPRLDSDQADISSDDDTVLNEGSPMVDENHQSSAVNELSDEDVRDALIIANTRLGTKFNIREIEPVISRTNLRNRTKKQLANMLICFCMMKMSESDEEDAGDQSVPERDVDDLSNLISLQNGDTVHHIFLSFRCAYCQRLFENGDYLQQHMVIHDIGERTCSVCGRVMGSPNSRHLHERRHRQIQ